MAEKPWGILRFCLLMPLIPLVLTACMSMNVLPQPPEQRDYGQVFGAPDLTVTVQPSTVTQTELAPLAGTVVAPPAAPALRPLYRNQQGMTLSVNAMSGRSLTAMNIIPNPFGRDCSNITVIYWPRAQRSRDDPYYNSPAYSIVLATRGVDALERAIIVDSDDTTSPERRFAIAHECGHQVRGDIQDPVSEASVTQAQLHAREFNSDEWACLMLMRKGEPQTVQGGINTLNSYPDVVSPTHPTMSARVARLEGCLNS